MANGPFGPDVSHLRGDTIRISSFDFPNASNTVSRGVNAMVMTPGHTRRQAGKEAGRKGASLLR